VHPTALPRRSRKDLGDRGLESQVRVTNHELHARESAFTQTLEELGPKGGVLGVTDGDGEDLSTGVLGDARRDHDGDDASRPGP